MRDELRDLVTRLEHAFNDRLVSVILYGSAAAGESDARFSDLNVFCVLKQITPRELSEGEPVMKWWRDKGYIAPLLMTEEEAADSADSFPIEFRDMKDHRQVLYGLDVIAELRVDTRHHRTQVEHELRANLLRLRQHGARVLSDPEALLLLCLNSVSTFVVLGRHALLAGGKETKHGRHAVVKQLTEATGVAMTPLDTLLSLREDRSGVEPGDPGELFAQYLQCVEGLIRFVDGLETAG